MRGEEEWGNQVEDDEKEVQGVGMKRDARMQERDVGISSIPEQM